MNEKGNLPVALFLCKRTFKKSIGNDNFSEIVHFFLHIEH